MTPEERIDYLEGRLAELEQTMGVRDPVPVGIGLSFAQRIIMSLLIRHPLVTNGMIEAAIYGGADGPEDVLGVIRVQISHMRRKLKQIQVRIHNEFGVGYYLDTNTRKRLVVLAQEESEKMANAIQSSVGRTQTDYKTRAERAAEAQAGERA